MGGEDRRPELILQASREVLLRPDQVNNIRLKLEVAVAEIQKVLYNSEQRYNDLFAERRRHLTNIYVIRARTAIPDVSQVAFEICHAFRTPIRQLDDSEDHERYSCSLSAHVAAAAVNLWPAALESLIPEAIPINRSFYIVDAAHNVNSAYRTAELLETNQTSSAPIQKIALTIAEYLINS